MVKRHDRGSARPPGVESLPPRQVLREAIWQIKPRHRLAHASGTSTVIVAKADADARAELMREALGLQKLVDANTLTAEDAAGLLIVRISSGLYPPGTVTERVLRPIVLLTLSLVMTHESQFMTRGGYGIPIAAYEKGRVVLRAAAFLRAQYQRYRVWIGRFEASGERQRALLRAAEGPFVPGGILKWVVRSAASRGVHLEAEDVLREVEVAAIDPAVALGNLFRKERDGTYRLWPRQTRDLVIRGKPRLHAATGRGRDEDDTQLPDLDTLEAAADRARDARNVRAIREILERYQEERIRLKTRRNAVAVRAVRDNLTALLLGEITQARVAEQAGCTRSRVAEALAKERKGLEAYPPFRALA
jgi:hypothetical protein